MFFIFGEFRNLGKCVNLENVVILKLGNLEKYMLKTEKTKLPIPPKFQDFQDNSLSDVLVFFPGLSI